MSKTVYDAFIGSHFDPVFSSAAAFSGAEDAARLNVPALHAKARKGIETLVEFARDRIDDPVARILLIEGDAGLGKTHVVTSTLFQLSQANRVTPAAFQLSADVPEAEMARWLLSSTVRELEARHFRDAKGRPPLVRLADSLLELADFDRGVLERAVDDLDDDIAVAEAVRAARFIGRALRGRSTTPPDEHVISAVILTAYHGWPAARAWLLGGGEARLEGLKLPSHGAQDDYFQVLRSLSVLAAAIDAPLVLVFDQVEATMAASAGPLLARVITQACQLVETTPGTGLVLSALTGTVQAELKQHLAASIGDRILKAPSAPVMLAVPPPEVIRNVLDRRCHELFRRANIDAEADAARLAVPSWLLENSGARTIREVFAEVRRYRDQCRTAGRFIDENDYRSRKVSNGEDKAPPVDDFDKLWEDKKDKGYAKVLHLADHERATMFIELAKRATDEIPEVGEVSAIELDSKVNATRIVDLGFWDDDSNPVERWRIGFVDQPNQRGKFRAQLDEFLDSGASAHPAVLRRTRIPGVEDGRPRSSKSLEQLQSGPALKRLFDAGGRAAHVPDEDWARLRLALDFCRERAHSRGFKEWRRQRRFLTEAAGIGELTRLVLPSEAPPEHESRDIDGEPRCDDEATVPCLPANGSVSSADLAPAMSDVDPRDSARMLIGSHDGGDITWNLDRRAQPTLPNFGLLVSGDAGQGKTQLIKAIIADAAELGCPVTIFDFKNDYGDEFAIQHGFEVVSLRDGLPFNPLRLPPRGKSGAQAIDHVFEVAGVLQASLGLGEQQKAMLRQALEAAYVQLGIPLREWVDPAKRPGPAMTDVVALAEEAHGDKAVGLVNRLGLLHGLRLLPSDPNARMTFEEVVNSRLVLAFHELPNDDAVKRALAELILIQLQAHMLRGDAPRALRRLLVFDEAWRASDSDRLIAIAREGRAFGVGLVTGSQFADDLSEELTGNLASKLHLYNSQAGQRRKIVQATYGTTASREARALMQDLGKLEQFEGIFRNQQHSPFTPVRVEPYFERIR